MNRVNVDIYRKFQIKNVKTILDCRWKVHLCLWLIRWQLGSTHFCYCFNNLLSYQLTNQPTNQPANKPKYFNCLAMESCCSAVSAINSSTMDLFGIQGMHQNLPGIDKREHTYSLSLLSIKVTCFIQNTAMRQRIIINQAHMPATKFHAL